MLRARKFYWTILSLLILVSFPRLPASANQPGLQVPPEFRLVLEGSGVRLFQKNYSQGSPDYVQVIDLSQGASIKLLHGDIADPRAGKGRFGGNDARLTSKSLENYWNDLAASTGAPFCVTNGQFFYMPEYPTRLPFSLKVDGNLISDGYGVNDHPGQQLMLELWPGRADIRELTQEALYASTAPDIVAGLTEDANKAAKKFVGRTFIGLLDPGPDGLFQTLLIFNTRVARQVEAAAILRSFGAVKLMMLDGGGSTQLICEGTSFISSDRLIPQAIGVVSGSGPVKAAPAQAELQSAPPSDGSAEQSSAGVVVAAVTPAASIANLSLQAIPSSPPPAAQADTPLPAAQTPNDQSEQAAPAPLPVSLDSGSPQPNASVPVPTNPQIPAQADQPSPDSSAAPAANLAAITTKPDQAGLVPAITGHANQPATTSDSTNQNYRQNSEDVEINFDDILWIPVSMSPVVLLLLAVIIKRQWHP